MKRGHVINAYIRVKIFNLERHKGSFKYPICPYARSVHVPYRSDIVVFGSFSDNASESILDFLKAVYLGDLFSSDLRIRVMFGGLVTARFHLQTCINNGYMDVAVVKAVLKSCVRQIIRKSRICIK